MSTNNPPMDTDKLLVFINAAIPELEKLSLEFQATKTDDSYNWTELYIYDSITKEHLTFYIPHIRIFEYLNANTPRAKEYLLDLTIQDILFDQEPNLSDGMSNEELGFLLEENFDTSCINDWSYVDSIGSLIHC